MSPVLHTPKSQNLLVPIKVKMDAVIRPKNKIHQFKVTNLFPFEEKSLASDFNKNLHHTNKRDKSRRRNIGIKPPCNRKMLLSGGRIQTSALYSHHKSPLVLTQKFARNKRIILRYFYFLRIF